MHKDFFFLEYHVSTNQTTTDHLCYVGQRARSKGIPMRGDDEKIEKQKAYKIQERGGISGGLSLIGRHWQYVYHLRKQK